MIQNWLTEESIKSLVWRIISRHGDNCLARRKLGRIIEYASIASVGPRARLQEPVSDKVCCLGVSWGISNMLC